jgi:hypothetical protein
MRASMRARWAGLVAALLLTAVAACNDLLKVENPQEIGVDQLGNAQLLDALVAGVRAAFAENIAGDEAAVVQAGTFLTDETVTGLNWEDWARANQRIVAYFEGPVNNIWSTQSEIIRNGELALQRLAELAASPDSDSRVALVEALVGYGYVFVGETMCQAVFGAADQLGTTIHTPPEIFPMAIPHFERAIQVGTAAGETDIVNLARVGLARAYLNLADFANVTTYASAVPPGFQYWIEFSGEQDDLNNNLFNEVHGALHTIGVHPAFLQGTYGEQNLIDTQTDPRIQHTTDWTTGHNGLTTLYKPYQGLRFSGYTGNTLAPPTACTGCTGANEGNGDDGDVRLYQKDTDVLLADYTEAQHHLHEALMRQGGNDAAVNTFVNARRAVGNDAPVSLAGDPLFAELRRQRSRDFYMGGFRLGDLRRWKRQGVGDFFPTGPHPNSPQWSNYGPWTCFPLPLEEYEGNTGLQRPADPLTPPGI